MCLGFVVSSLLALIQGTLLFVLGLPVSSIGLLYMTALVTAWSYMSIIMFLVMTFDNPGRYAAMILLVLQLGGAAGIFPIQLQVRPFQWIYPYLPMSYSLGAYKNAIASGSSYPFVAECYTTLSILTGSFIGLLKLSMNSLQMNDLFDSSLVNDNDRLIEMKKKKVDRLPFRNEQNGVKKSNESEEKNV